MKRKSAVDEFKGMELSMDKFGIKRKQGRPAMDEDTKMVNKNIRFTPAQIVKLSLLGGAKWIRNKVNQAKVK